MLRIRTTGKQPCGNKKMRQICYDS